ncbi:MAG TPA: RNA methyltransferase [Cyclobacteriaceae bacterium]|jgi:tRNA (guanosine-2'-O-)-methyltransferase|nr:RNA methyltransferase [Cytophagales bacterium]HRE68738.1 RNA methyltransferase [Cyclobacteriaceae bacterium]HRF35315.1 RNA methyltransferase [Cyclobacteriaceae bacterium]
MTEFKRNQLLTQHLANYITDHKKEFVNQVLDKRTRHVTVVLEEIFQSQNASAVIRTCECMGLQDIHIIENEVKYAINRRVLKGSYKWVDMIKYRTQQKTGTQQCFAELKQRGYTILVTDPSPDGKSIYDVAIDKKLAIVMGNELHGTSAYALTHADEKVHIPMYGFTESLNISVSAALCLQAIIPRVRQSDIAWQLTEAEKDLIRLQWYRKMVKRCEIIEREFLKTLPVSD